MTTDQTRDPFAVLTAARPTDMRLDEAWTDTRADAAFRALTERLEAERNPVEPAGAGAVRRAPRHRGGLTRRRWLAVGAVAAAAALASVAGVLAPEATLPKAAAVEQLAARAAVAPARTLGPGQFIHLVQDSTQEGRDRYTPELDLTNESWTDATGASWRRDVSRVPALPVAYLSFAPTDLGPGALPGTKPSDYATWPTDPTTLKAFLESRFAGHAPGKTVDDSQPIFENLSDRFAMGMTPPELNAALIRVIGSLPEVHVADVSFAGHDAVRLEYRGMYVNAMYFDKESAAYLGETVPGGRTVVRTQEVVDEVPAEVLAQAVLQGNDDTSASVNGTTPAR